MNSQKEKTYPNNLADVFAMGTDEWLNWSHPLPSGERYIDIFNILLESYSKARPSKECCESLFWACAINYKVIPVFAQSYYKFHIMTELERQGFTHVGVASPAPIDDAIRECLKRSHCKRTVPLISHIERLKEYWRIIRTNYGRSLLAALFPSLRDHSCFMIGDSNQKEVKAFHEETGKVPVCLRPVLFIKKKHLSITRGEKIKARDFCNRFFEEIGKIEPLIADFATPKFRTDFFESILETMRTFNSIKATLAKHQAGDLLVTHVGNPFHRVFAAAWKATGGNVIGLTHGNIYTCAYLPAGFTTGLNSVLNTFMVSSAGEKRLLDDAKKHFKKGMCSDYLVKHFQHSPNKQILKSFSNDPPAKEVRHVMIIGYPISYTFSCCIPENHTMAILSLELKLIKALKKAGYKITYKAHPDTLGEIGKFFNDLVDIVETKPFESVHLECDCYVFPHPFSSTFGIALMTNRPIVLLTNLESNHWHPDILPLLSERCGIVETSVDERRRISFVEDDLLEAVRNSINLMDSAIIEEFAL